MDSNTYKNIQQKIEKMYGKRPVSTLLKRSWIDLQFLDKKSFEAGNWFKIS
jgi:hypothetical protein